MTEYYINDLNEKEINTFFNVILELASDRNFRSGNSNEAFNNLDNEKSELLKKGFKSMRSQEAHHWADASFVDYEKKLRETNYGKDEKLAIVTKNNVGHFGKVVNTDLFYFHLNNQSSLRADMLIWRIKDLVQNKIEQNKIEQSGAKNDLKH